jgi:hypothetical protein
MQSRPLIRIVADLILLILVVYGQWYVALPLGLVAAWLFPYYVELLMLGLIHDALFGLGHGLDPWAHAGLVIAIVALGLASFLRGFMRR